MATYPSGIVSTATLINVANPTTTPTNNPSHATQHDNLNGEVIAIETALGINPQGSYASVAAAIATINTAATAALTTATAALASAATALTTATAAQTTATAALTTAAGAVVAATYTTNGVLVAGTATAGHYIAIGAPGTTGYLLTAGTATSGGMYWAAPSITGITAYPGVGVAVSPGTGGPWSASLTVGTGANNLVQLTATAGQLPTLSGVNLTGITSAGITMALGAYNTTSYAVNNTYQAGADGFVSCYGYSTSTAGVGIFGYTDTSSNPTTGSNPGSVAEGGLIPIGAGIGVGTVYASVFFAVKKNSYFTVACTIGQVSAVRWIPLGV